MEQIPKLIGISVFQAAEYYTVFPFFKEFITGDGAIQMDDQRKFDFTERVFIAVPG